MILAIFALLALVIAITPYVLSLDSFRKRIESGISSAMGVPVQIAEHDFSWFHGITVTGVRVDNAPGFDASHPLLALNEARFHVALGALLSGHFDVTGTVEDLQLHVDQNEGRTNLEALFAKEPDAPTPAEPGTEPPVETTDSEPLDLGKVRVDLRFANARIDVTRDGELLESLRDVDCALLKSYDDATLRLDLTAALQGPTPTASPGTLSARADIELDEETVDARLTTSGLDVGRYRPLLAAFFEPGAITELAGVLRGDLVLKAKGTEDVQASGEMVVEGPRLAGALLQGMQVEAPRWTLKPNLTVTRTEDGQAVVQAEGLALDLGFCQVRGLDAAATQEALGSDAHGLAVHYVLDLDTLVGFGGPMPELLRGTGGRVSGTLALPWEALEEDATGTLLQAMRASADLDLPKLAIHAFEVTGLQSHIDLQGGKLALRSAEGAKLNAGPVTLLLNADLTAEHTPVQFALSWQDGKVRGKATELLRYPIPLLAGLGETASFQSGIGGSLQVQGPGMPGADDNLLQWLQRWSGRGEVHLANGSFSPAQALQGLLAATGADSALAIDKLDTKFRLREGFIESTLGNWSSKGQRYGITGRTGLDGTVDYDIDLSATLKGHRDGEKILAALKGAPLKASLRGSVDAPAFAMPDLGQLIQQGLQGQLQDLIKKKSGEDLQGKMEAEAKRALEKLFGGKKKKD